MVSATTGELGPITTGIVYCAVILECMELFDLRRASEWTDALAAWCDAQPELVPYRGQCLVHRSQLQQAGGNWSEAIASVRGAPAPRRSAPPRPWPRAVSRGRNAPAPWAVRTGRGQLPAGERVWP